jgi:hypothetical protein
MGFLSKKWLRKLWGVNEPGTAVMAPIDCEACRTARAAGRDACAEHGVKHASPHLYHVGHEISWSSPLSMDNATMPRRDSESIH